MGIEYAYVDTCVLSDILRQYDPRNPHKTLIEGSSLKRDMLKVVNRIIADEEELSGYIITSTFSFVELLNQYETIFAGSVPIARILAVMTQPPTWLIVDEINSDTALNYCDVPNSIDGENVSSDDAVHVATAMQRGDDIFFLTPDHIISKMNIPKITFINT